MAREARHFVDEAFFGDFSDFLLFFVNIFSECCNTYSVYWVYRLINCTVSSSGDMDLATKVLQRGAKLEMQDCIAQNAAEKASSKRSRAIFAGLFYCILRWFW